MPDILTFGPFHQKTIRILFGWVLMIMAFLPLQGGGSSAISVGVDPTWGTLLVGSNQQFTAVVQGTNKTAVTWSCNGGAITSTGLYTAPSTPGNYTIKATLVSNTAKYGTTSVDVVVNQISGVSINPSSATVGASQSIYFTSRVTGSGDLSGTWSFSDGKPSSTGGPWILPYGTYNVGSWSYVAPTNPGTYTVTYTCTQDPSKSATATITVIPPGLTVSPAVVNLPSGGTQQFTASVVGMGNTAVTWSCSGGSINPAGLYTAPSTMGNYTVTATSVQDSSQVAIANVKVSIKVSFYWPSISLFPNDSRLLTAKVEGASNSSVAFSCSGGSLVPIGTSQIRYTAPASAGRYTITATSIADPNQSASLDVYVTVQVTVQSPPSNLMVGTTYQFTSTVNGTDDKRVTWSLLTSGQGISISPEGLLIAPATTPVGSSLSGYAYATSVIDPTQSGDSYFNILEPPSITVTPENLTVPIGGVVTIQAMPRGSSVSPKRVIWNPSSGSMEPIPPSIDFTDNTKFQYRAPRFPGSYTIKVSPNKDDGTTSPVPGVLATATVTVVAAPAIVKLTPGLVAIETGGSQQYHATVTGVSDPTILWACTAGSISADGFYTAPATTGTYTITASAKADGTKSASITVIVKTATVRPKFSITPKAISVSPGGTVTFTGSAVGLADPTFIWDDYFYGTGTFSSTGNSGTFKAPATLENQDPRAFRLEAHSLQDYEVTAQSIITLLPAGPISIAMNSSNVVECVSGEKMKFLATVSGTTDQRVLWSGSNLDSATGDFDSADLGATSPGYYDYPFNAVSVADQTRKAYSSVRVWTKGSVVVSKPINLNLLAGQQLQLNVEVKGGGGVVWSTNFGTISPTGLFTAPATVAEDTEAAVQATNALNDKYNDTIWVSVRVSGSISISPLTANLPTSGKQTFTAKVYGSSASVTWSVRMQDPASTLNPGTISKTGVYTAPSSLNLGEFHRSVYVRATNVSDPAKWTDVIVSVFPLAGTQPKPTPGTIDLGGVTSLWTGTTRTAYYNGDNNVAWSIQGGTILATGRQQFGNPPRFYCVYQVGNAGTNTTLTVTNSNAAGSVTVTSSPISVIAIPTFGGTYVYTDSTTTRTYSILDFGTVTETRTDGTQATYRKIWVNETAGALEGNDISVANSYLGSFSIDGKTFNFQGASQMIPAPLTSGIIIGVDPKSGAYARIGSTLQFYAGVGGTTTKTVAWTASAGSINASGLYTPPSISGTYTVTATSLADTSKSYSVKVGVSTGTSVSGITGVFNGTTTYSGSDPQSWPISVFSDSGKTYVKLYGVNQWSGANQAIATGTVSGRTFTGHFMEYNPSWYATDSESVSLMFEPQTDGSTALSGGFNTLHLFPTGGGGGTVSSTPVWASFTGALSAGQIDVAVIPHLQDGYYGSSYSNGSPQPHILAGTTQILTALVCGTTNTAVNWTGWNGDPTGGGTFSPGAFSTTTGATTTVTFPQVSTTGVNVTITATSAALTSKSDRVSTPVDTSAGTVRAYPTTIYLATGRDEAGGSGYYPTASEITATFPQAPSDDSDFAILEGGDHGSLVRDRWSDHVVSYLPGNTPGVYSVVATSSWDATRQGTAKITVAEADPAILYANLDKTSVLAGTPISLTWWGAWAFNTPNPKIILKILDQVTNTSQVLDVTDQNAYTCTPGHSMTFTFTVSSASGKMGTQSFNLYVDPTQGASIYLSPNPAPFQETLMASVFFQQGTASVEIKNASGWVDLGPSTNAAGFTIDPSKVHWSGDIQLRAKITDSVGNIGYVTTSAPIMPKILSMTANPGGVLTGSSQGVTLNWSINSAGRSATQELKATNSQGTVTVPLSNGGSTSIVVYPAETTTYNLTVTTKYYTSSLGWVSMTDQKSITVRVGTVATLSISPPTISLPPGGSITFTSVIIALPGKDGMTWTATGGTLTGGGTSVSYQAPMTEGTYQVSVASVVDPTLVATANVTVKVGATGGTPPSSSPFDILGFISGPSTLGADHRLLSWSTIGTTGLSLRDSNAGETDVTGTNSIDVIPNGTTIYTLTATDGKQYISRTVTVPGAGYAIAVVPTHVVMFPGVTFKFGNSIYAPSNRVTWTCDGGNVAADGTYTAPSTPGTYIVTGTLVDDPSKTASAIVTVNQISLQITPGYVSLASGQSFGFGFQMFSLSGDTPTWTASAGSIQPNGLFTAPLSPGSVTITLTSSKDLTVSTTATVEVKPIDLMVLPSVLWVRPQGQYQLAAGTSLGEVNWSVVEGNGGSIDANGIYTAPNEVGTYTIRATSALDSSRFATAKAIVANSGSGGNWGPGSGGGGTYSPKNFGVSVDPAMSTVDAGTYIALNATVLGSEDQSVTWSIAGDNPKASVDEQGVFTAHEPGIYSVIATSKTDTTLQGSALMVVQSSVHGLENTPAALDLEGYSVTVLNDGKVLLAGGQDTRIYETDPDKGYRGTAYLYDSEAKAFTPTGNLGQARAGHTATLLSDGRVLIAGGMGFFKWPTNPNATMIEQPVKWGEIYNPATGLFESLPVSPDHALYPSGSMRSAHGTTGQAVVLAPNPVLGWSGGQVVTVGGPSGAQTSWPFDVFNPTTNLFDLSDIEAGAQGNDGLFQTREDGAVVALDDGRALLTGGTKTYGVNDTSPCGWSRCTLTEARVFNPQTPGALIPMAPMTQARAGHSMTKLPNGKILIIGGSDHGTHISGTIGQYLPNPTATAELFDPQDGTFTPTGSMKWARAGHAAILLPTGQVMIMGGFTSVTGDSTNQTWLYPTESELYDPDAGTFSVMDKLAFGLDRPKLALMQNGGVFVAGKPIITASAGTPAAGIMAKGSKRVQSVIAPQTLTGSGGLLEAVFGTVSAATLEVDYITVNQGVEKYLNDENTRDGKPETQALLKLWKQDVPSIAYRPAKIDVYFKSNHPMTLEEVQKLKARIRLFSPMGDLGQPKEVKVDLVGPYSVRYKTSFILSEQETLPSAKIKIILDPTREIYPTSLPLEKTTIESDPKWKNRASIRFRVIPIRYVDAAVRSVTNPDGTTTAYPNGIDMAPPVVDASMLQGFKDVLMRLYPASTLEYMGSLPETVYDYIVGTPSTVDGSPTRIAINSGPIGTYDGWQRICEEIEKKRKFETSFDDTLYLGIVAECVPQWSPSPQYPKGATMNGKALDFPDISMLDIRNISSVFRDLVLTDTYFSPMPHELGHSFNRHHAPTPADLISGAGVPGGADPDYPYIPGGRIGTASSFDLFDVVSKTTFSTINGVKVEYDLMGYRKPRWISDYTYGGIAMMHQQFIQIARPAAALIIGALPTTTKIMAQSPVTVYEGSSAVIALRFDQNDQVRVTDISPGKRNLKITRSQVGEYVFRALGESGNQYETRFQPRESPHGESKSCTIAIPEPESWIGYSIFHGEKLLYTERFKVNSASLSRMKPMSLKATGKSGQSMLVAGKSSRAIDWGGTTPSYAWARASWDEGKTWEAISNFYAASAILEIPARILDKNAHPIVEVHAQYGFSERIQKFVWGDPGN